MPARVLVVDDDPATVNLVQEFLLAKGYEVSTAFDGLEGLQKVKGERPHLVLLDVRMPKMDDLEVLRQLREIDKEVAVIMITAVNEEEIARQAFVETAPPSSSYSSSKTPSFTYRKRVFQASLGRVIFS